MRNINQEHPQQKFNKCKENIGLKTLDRAQHYIHSIPFLLPPTQVTKSPVVQRYRYKYIYQTIGDVSLVHRQIYQLWLLSASS